MVSHLAWLDLVGWVVGVLGVCGASYVLLLYSIIPGCPDLDADQEKDLYIVIILGSSLVFMNLEPFSSVTEHSIGRLMAYFVLTLLQIYILSDVVTRNMDELITPWEALRMVWVKEENEGRTNK